MNPANKRPILQIIDHLGPGGAQRQFVELAIGLKKQGYPLLVCALDAHQDAFIPPLQEHGIEVRLIAQSGKLDVTAAKNLYTLLKEFQPAVIQTWLYTADMYGRAAAWFYNLSAKHKACTISSVRSAETDKKLHYVWVDRMLKTVTDGFIVNAKILAKTLHEREWVAYDKIHTIYNGINFEYFSSSETPTNNQAISSKECVIAYIGRFSQEKRPELFIEAAAEIAIVDDDLRFLMIGSGDTTMIRQLIVAKGKEFEAKITLQGFSDDIAPLLEKIDILVSCSDYEGCSNTILEAMAAGVPVVATDVGGNPELIREDGGWLVPAGSAHAIAKAVLSALTDKAGLEKVRSVARARVQQEFTQANMVACHEALYQTLCDGKKSTHD